MKFFRREVELTLKALGVTTLVALIVLSVAWGYGQRRQAKVWQHVACAYRIREVTRSAPFMTAVERGADPCATLARLGFAITDTPEYTIMPATATRVAARAR